MRATRSDVIWNYVGIFMALGSNFLLLPFLVYFLDGDLLGLWYVFLSVGGIVTLFDFGFGPTLARNVAYTWSGATQLIEKDVIFAKRKEPNILLLKKVLLTCKRIYLIISLFGLIILMTFGTYYINSISSNIQGDLHIIAWIIYSVAVFLNLYFGYYITFLRGVGAIKQVNIATISARAIQIIMTILLLYFGLGILGVSIAYFIYGLIFRTISKELFYKYEAIGARIKIDNTKLDLQEMKSIFKVIWHNAWRDGLVSVSKYLSNQATVVVASMFLTLTQTGYYSISIQLVSAISAISGALYTAFQPSLQSLYVTKELEESKRLMSIAMTTYILLFWTGILALILVGIPLISLINPNFQIDILVLLSVSVYDFLLKHHSYYASYISNTNKVPYMIPFIASSFIGIFLAVILIRFTSLGIWALILSQILSQAIYNNWKWPFVVMKTFNTNYFQMFRMGISEIIGYFKVRING